MRSQFEGNGGQVKSRDKIVRVRGKTAADNITSWSTGLEKGGILRNV